MMETLKEGDQLGDLSSHEKIIEIGKVKVVPVLN
jgi:hypothetical protein